jgi:hypothetical protein
MPKQMEMSALQIEALKLLSVARHLSARLRAMRHSAFVVVDGRRV